MLPTVGQKFTVDIPKFRNSYDSKYPFEATLISIGITDNDTDREFKILNHNTGCFLEVEKNWFNPELTGRLIKFHQ